MRLDSFRCWSNVLPYSIFSLAYPFAIVNSESRFSARFLCGPNVQLPLAKISRRNGPTTLCNRQRQRQRESERERGRESETPAGATAVIRYLLRQVQPVCPLPEIKEVLINGFTCDTYLFACPILGLGINNFVVG